MIEQAKRIGSGTLTGMMLLWVGAMPAKAQSKAAPAPQITALEQCRTKTDAAERLACFDRAVETLLAATKSEDVLVIQQGEVRKARKGLFGFTLPRIDFLSGRAGNRDDAEDARRLEGKVTSAQSIGRGLWRFSIEGAGVWQTLETSFRLADPQPGVTAVIERTMMGAYFVQFGKGGQVQAKRVQ